MYDSSCDPEAERQESEPDFRLDANSKGLRNLLRNQNNLRSAEDKRKAWSLGTYNMKPGLLRLSKWELDFNPRTQRQTHVQAWVRIYDLPQEYWRPRILFEIAGGLGTPLILDEATKNRSFGHYARILVDINLSQRLFDDILVEREGHAFYVEIVYEKLPEYCDYCKSIGHPVNSCNKLKPKMTVEDNRTKQMKPSKPQIRTKFVEKESKSSDSVNC
ncbi:uncharacterized protein LOC123896450 [Trifolium pratense]|uniref:uncharacterized protein LOC123896450 n=1 Tax=Trifolium pratense TaxID=57577 RepID=UPI001E693C7D|nr:uncharacterized protein LOC123896450 [Trifolium pratense]